MNTLEKALDQLKNCSKIIACKTFDEVKSLFDDLSKQCYTCALRCFALHSTIQKP